jgi:hypothetical protein
MHAFDLGVFQLKFIDAFVLRDAQVAVFALQLSRSVD